MKKVFKTIMIFIIFLLLLSIQVKASTSNEKMEELISKYKNIDINSVSNEELEKMKH